MVVTFSPTYNLAPTTVRSARRPDATSHIFLNNAGRQWNRNALAHALVRVKQRHGINTNATLHGLRHRMATAAIAAGASVKMVAEQLGHATTTITERYYFHRSEEQIEAMRAAVVLGLPSRIEISG